MDGSAGNIQVYADCKNIPQESRDLIPYIDYSEPGYTDGSIATYAGCLDPSSPPKKSLNGTNLIIK